MNNIYIDTCESIWLEKKFKKGQVSLDELLNACEDLIIENIELKKELEELNQDLQDNYKPINPEYD